MTAEIDITLSLEDLQKFYTSYFSYYNTLNTQYQQLFLKRCSRFIYEKTIIGAEGFVPTNKVKAIIAASAVQLTLGLQSWNFNYFETIIIHPSDFDDKVTGLKFKGETNLAGYIRLSWKGFIAGYRIGDDNINLGLHEFMHAIRFSAVRGDIQDYFIEHYFDKWLAAATEAYMDTRNERETVFRKYGGTNINEFLSVCIEHYFESPQEIKNEYPHLYYCTAILLNQQTQNKITQINIRDLFLRESNALQTEFADRVMRSVPRKSATMTISLLIAALLLNAIYEAGLFSAPAVFLFILFAIAYTLFDSRHTKISFYKKEIVVSKGLFLFKGWKKHSVMISELVSFRVYNNKENDNDWEIVFYDQKSEHFYEETVRTNQPIDPLFVNELVSNKIAYFKS